MAYTFNLSANQSLNCGYITVNDVSTITAPDTREDNCIALFWALNGTFNGADFSNSGSTGSPGEWFITAFNGTYTITGYLFPQWVLGTAYANGDIVGDFVNGTDFWVAQGVIASSDYPPSEDPLNWSLLTNDAAGMALCGVAGNLVDDTTFDELVQCPDFRLVKTSCLNYTLYNLVGGSSTYTVRVATWDQATFTDYALSNTINDTVDITLTEDGVYQLDILPDSGQGISVFTEPIFEFCALRVCAENMINQLLGTCDDPCSTHCHDDCQNQLNIYRNELNKIIALYFPLVGMIYMDKTIYAGIFSIADDRASNIEKIGQMIDQLKVITNRCGVCNGTSNNSNSITTDCGC